MTLTNNDTDIIELIDFDSVPPCNKKSCPDEAKWAIIVKCCGDTRIFCPDHKKVFIQRFYQVIDTRGLYCAKCHIEVRNVRINEVVIIREL